MPRKKRGGCIGRQTKSQRQYRQNRPNSSDVRDSDQLITHSQTDPADELQIRIQPSNSSEVSGSDQPIVNLQINSRNAPQNQNQHSNSSHVLEGNQSFRDLQTQFENELQSVNLQECNNCSRLSLQSKESPVCSQCKRNPHKFTAYNNMDPGIVPPELQDLTFIEQLLIAKVQPVMRLYRIKSRGLPGQYAYKGNIINIGQNISEVVRLLPRTTSSLSVIIVRREILGEHRDFHVRRGKVLGALTVLKRINAYYADIDIDMDQLSQLPVDGNIFKQLKTVQLSENWEDSDEEPGQVYESVIPHDIRLQQADRIESDINNIVPWPQATNVINEFTCEGYVTMAFPALFPTGKAELKDNSRSIKLTSLEYFQYLLQYKDQRFARDPRFRYFALNTVQRHEAIKRGTIFAKKSHFNGTIQDLRNTMTNNPRIVSSLYYWCAKIRGSNSYWFQRRGELEDMVNQLDLPTGFLTLSAADLWWPDLARLMGCNFEREELLNEHQIALQRQKLVNENPRIVEEYFNYRAITFVDSVLCKRYKISDYWFRYEFQHRGSCHLHGVFWFSDAPNPNDFDTATEEQLSFAKSYYDGLVSAINPSPSIPPAILHPSRIRSTDVDIDDSRGISELLNRVQRHTRCTKGYCLRWNGNKFACRFKFPKEIQEESTLQKDEKGHWVYTPARNDEKLNQHNSFIAQTWRANTDFQVITSKYVIVNYIAKYASKSEPASKSLTEMFEEIVRSRDNDDQSRHAYTSLMIKVIGERDIGACETCHLLLGIPLFHATRTFQVLVIRLEDYVTVRGTDDDTNSLSFIEFYRIRPDHMENITLFEFAKKHYKGRNNSIATSRKDKIVQVFPKLDKNKESNLELICKQQLMLHSSWRSEQNLKNNGETWKAAFDRHNIPVIENFNMSLLSPNEDNDDDINEDIVFNDRDWIAAAAVPPNALPTHVSLGNRDIDINYNWTSAYHNYSGIRNDINFIERSREATENATKHFSPTGIFFNDQQNSILSFLKHQLLNYDDCKDRCIIIQGKAGTGKSCVINEMVYQIDSHYKCNATLLMAPTGVAANNINGQTLHSALRIPPSRGALPELSGEAKLAFEEEFRDIKFIVIDEASMLGLNLMFKVDRRLRQAKPLSSHLPFGGVCIYLVGDWSQLPPVCDLSLYNIGRSAITIQSSLLYRQFTTVFFLTEIMRQMGDEQKSFRDTLNRISNGTISESDYRLLSSRFYVNNISDKSFDDTVCIMSKNSEIDKFNYNKLENNKQPIALIKGIHNCSEASAASSDEAQGLSAELRLCKGARIILRRNLWVSKGLANGSAGTITDIIYDPSVECDNYNDYMPLCLLVHFDKYTGPTLYGSSVPIIPVTSSFKRVGVSCTRKQFPVMLGYAISIHRSQGITVDKAIVDIGDNEFQVGLTYVALSRVKTLNGLLLKPAFNFDRLLKINNSKSMIARREELERLRNLANKN